MDVRETNKIEIEGRLKDMGDFMKMHYLESCLKSVLNFETKKFVLTRLAGIYEVRRMFRDAGRLFRDSADINSTYDGKIQDFLKSGELFIQAGQFDEADVSFSKAKGCGNDSQKARIKKAEKEFYKIRARMALSNGKKRYAIDAYEKLLKLDLDSKDKVGVENELLELYRSLGKMVEYEGLRKRISS
tara:strand:- start:881 stop:1441 length:561 start_codon:yes stop_codon:yes gene_type:complete